LAQQLLNRYGVLTRESIASENISGGFSAVYDVLKAMEESGKIRRGYFVAGLGATQFALPSAVDLLRSLRGGSQQSQSEMITLAATDPANPYGAVLRWPTIQETPGQDGSVARTLTRSSGASVVLRNGELIAYLRRGNPNMQFFLPQEEPERSNAARDLGSHLAVSAQAEMQQGEEAQQRGGLLIATVNGEPTHLHWTARILQEAGFQAAPMGFNVRRVLKPLAART
jgi:ATP-dependent Lhr-like helicase